MADELVLGVDSSTQSTKAVLVDATTGEVVAQRSAPHPAGTSIDPRAWATAFDLATAELLPRASAVAVGGQQHGMVALDASGAPVFDALLWNDTRSSAQAIDLIAELGGPQACAETVGSVLVASFTSTKLRWLRDHHPEAARRTHEVLLPHDYINRHLTGDAFTDRGDASGTGYYSTATDAWRPDLAETAIGHCVSLPRIVAPGAIGGMTPTGVPVAAGTGDNMASAFALDVQPGDVVVSIGTSGVASSISSTRVADGTGSVTGFADATGRFLPMATTMNAARILDLQSKLLDIDHDELGRLALAAPAGANGLTLLPYYGGERTPNRPRATGTWAGLTSSTSREDLARAAFEALLCSLADAVDLLTTMTGDPTRRILLIGGAATNPAVRTLAPAIFGAPVTVLAPGEYVALGAARQAAWALAGTPTPPTWPQPKAETHSADPTPAVREAYGLLRERTSSWT